MEEIWKTYKDTRYNPTGVLWEVSNQGNVRKNGKLYELKVHRGGYYGFNRYSVARAVAELFIPNPENKPEVDHINTIITDNRAVNLRWVTHKENMNNPLTKQHFSESRKGKPTWNKGKNSSEETKQKIREFRIGKNHLEETKNKMRETKNKLFAEKYYIITDKLPLNLKEKFSLSYDIEYSHSEMKNILSSSSICYYIKHGYIIRK